MLFNMLILGSLVDESGYVFHRSENDLFIVETTLPTDKNEVGDFLKRISLFKKKQLLTCSRD